MHSQVIEVTPSLAAEWMKSNSFNRNISRPTVDRYAADMAAGKWNLTHQGIGFDDDGILIDGQHRLSAVIKANATVPMMVTWGANKVGIDELRPRATADVIKFGGLSEWIDRKSAETAKAMIIGFAHRGKPVTLSTSQIVEFAENHKSAIVFSNSLFRTASKGVSSALVRSSFAVAYYHYPREDLEAMASALYSGIVNGKKDAAAVRLREALLTEKVSGGADRAAMTRKITRCIEAYMSGIPLSKLYEPKSLSFNLPEVENNAQ